MLVSEAITGVTFITLSTDEASIIKTRRKRNHVSEQMRRPNLCLQHWKVKSKHCSFSKVFLPFFLIISKMERNRSQN